MLVCRAWVCALVLALGACGKSKATATRPKAAHRLTAMPSAVLAPNDNRGPSKDILSSWTLPASPVAYAYADLEALFKTELIEGLVTSAMVLVQASLTPAAVECWLDWTHSVRKLAAAATEKEQLLIMTYDPGLLKSPVGQCLQIIGDLRRTQLANSAPAYVADPWVIVILRKVVLIGHRALVEASLSTSARSEWPNQLTLADQQQLVFTGVNQSKKLEVKGRLSVTKTHFSLSTDVGFPDMTSATAAATRLAPPLLGQHFVDASPQLQQMVVGITENWHVRQTGTSVGFEFRTDGSAQDMGQRLGMASALAIFSVRKFIAKAKTAEARTTLRAIAERLVATNPKKLTSLPAVPGKFEFVQGKKYQSLRSDWVHWKSIGFSLSDPQYYQYRVDAAKDGLSAEVIAQGDLNANGLKSRYSLAVQLEPTTHVLDIASELTEENPLE